MLDHARTMPRLVAIALTGVVKAICMMVRRADERRKLSGLSALEWRDLDIHRVRQELNKWPWEP